MKTLDKINLDTEEGKLLLTAMTIITTECRTDKTPYEVMEELNNLSKEIFKTNPSIYKAAGLTEATPLTDEELEKEAERLYPFIDSEYRDGSTRTQRQQDVEYNRSQKVARQAHIKARKMGSSGWVSVEDRLPEDGGCILIYSENGGVAEGAWISDKKHFEQWRWSCILDKVTHWQPLPSPPKEK